MPNAPAVKRVKNATFTKDELDKMAPPLRRMAQVNRAADKYKWSGPKK